MNVSAVNTRWKEIDLHCQRLKRDVVRATRALTDGVAIFGAGAYGEGVCRYLKKVGANVICFADNSPHKQGSVMEGVPIVSPRDVPRSAVVLIAARHAVMPVKRQLDEMKVRSLSFDAFFAVSTMDRIRHVRDMLLGDERSRVVYDGIVMAMLVGDESHCASVMEGNQFFALPEFVNIGTDIFVDAGAYVGDTVEKFMWAHNGVFRHIYAFEPGVPQFAALKTRVRRLLKEWAVAGSKITCVNAGLADKNRKMTMSMDPNMLQCSSFNASRPVTGSSAQLLSLDRYLAGRPVTSIKVDIEGMEMAMLRGAQETIRKCRPKMALSIYHKPADLFEIAEYVRSLVPEYRMAVRQHAPSLMDSVLYCWAGE